MSEQNNGDLDQFNKIGENPITVSILNAVPHALVGLVDRKIIFANNAVKTIFNIEPDKIIGQSTRMFYRNDEDFKRIAELFYPILEGKECFARDFPCQTYDGRDIVCNVSAARLGNVLKNRTIVVMYEDITARKQIESEQVLFRTLMDQSTDAIFVINPNTGGFIDINQRACDSLGYSKQELLTMTVLDIDPLFTPDKFFKHIEQELKVSGQVILETKHMRKDGYQFFVEINSRLITIEEKQYIISIARDISERKQEQSRLIALNKLKEELLSPGTLADKLQKITDQTVSIFNADFARIWMINPGDICDKDCVHSKNQQPEHFCRFKDKCLHLMASSGAYPDIVNSRHKRVPFDCYKIGKIASGEDLKFISNDVKNDPRIHDHQWVKERGLVSFAGYRVLSQGKTSGVFALFSKQEISANLDANLESIANAIGLIIQTAEIEKALRQSSDDWHRTFDAINDLIFIQDLNSVILKVNKAFADFLKMQPQEIEGKKCYELLHKKQHVFTGCPAQLTKKEQLSHSVEINDPQINIPLFVTTSPIFDERRQMVGVLHIAQNISQEKQVEKELKRKLHDLEIFRKSSVGREIKMLEMKKRIEELEKQIATNKQSEL
jgi:PAS domain S-box-containing protein